MALEVDTVSTALPAAPLSVTVEGLKEQLGAAGTAPVIALHESWTLPV
jgi:hypothetical protein